MTIEAVPPPRDELKIWLSEITLPVTPANRLIPSWYGLETVFPLMVILLPLRATIPLWAVPTLFDQPDS